MPNTHYAVIAISGCSEVKKERIEKLNDMLFAEFKGESIFRELYEKEWQRVEKIFTHTSPEFDVENVALEWLAEQVARPIDEIKEEFAKKLFVIKTPFPVPNAPSLWVVAHYFEGGG